MIVKQHILHNACWKNTCCVMDSDFRMFTVELCDDTTGMVVYPGFVSSTVCIYIYIYILSNKLTWMAGKSPNVFHRKYSYSCLVGIFQPVLFSFSFFFVYRSTLEKCPKIPAQVAIRDTWHTRHPNVEILFRDLWYLVNIGMQVPPS